MADVSRKKQPRKISRRYLENAALYYLQRYASSEANLRRVMKRKVDRSCAFHKTPPDEFYPVIDDMIERYARSGLLNDKGFAEAKATSLRRQGKSQRAIMAKLQVKGLKKSDIEMALKTVDEDVDAELTAAISLARRKKIGVFRVKSVTPEQKQKELAVMGRAGFSYEISRKALEYKEEDS